MKIRVKKRNGKFEALNLDKINQYIERATKGLEDVSVSDIAIGSRISFYDGITTDEICSSLIISAEQLIETEPNYSFAAARLLLHKLYKEVFGESVDSDAFDYQYRQSFIKNIKKLVKANRLDSRLLDFDLKDLAAHIVIGRDGLFQYPGIRTLNDRYLLKNGVRLESPQAFWMRVAMGLSVNEANPNEAAKRIYDEMSQFHYCHSTPTLFNSGTTHPQLSSCFLTTMEDSLDGIYGTMHEQARLSKYAGGLGLDFSSLRCADAKITGTAGKSNGVVPWMKVFNDTLIAVNQGGKRPGAGCAYLSVLHPDIEDFLELRKNTGDDRRRCHDMHTAVWVPDMFMRAVENDEDWYLLNPSDTPDLHELYGDDFEKRVHEYREMIAKGKPIVHKVVKAKEIWKKILINLKTNSHPWVTFKDIANKRYTDGHAGIVHNSNLCLEIIRHTISNKYDNGNLIEHGETAVCNLASINLSKMVDDGKINYQRLEQTVRFAVRALDNVIDINYYPIESARLSNMRYRPIGLGVMGLQDVLYAVGITYDTDEAVAFNNELFQHISYFAIDESANLAQEKGAYPRFDGSLWSKGILPMDTAEIPYDINQNIPWDALREKVKLGMRNGSLLAIAPTATISYIQGCSQSIEPDYSVLWVYSNLSDEFTMVNTFFVKEAKEKGIWCRELINAIKQCNGDLSRIAGELPEELKAKFRSVFNLDFDKIIDCNAARQVWIDQSQSFNLYTDKPSLKYLSDMYFRCWKQGLKTTYYVRSKAAGKIEQSTTDSILEPKVCAIDNPDCESCQ